MNSQANPSKADLEALDSCPDLTDLGSKLSGFSAFEVLRIEDSENRHSNVLAWLCQPKGNHGLDAGFLLNWLRSIARVRPDLTLPDLKAFRKVTVRREWRNIDLLIIIGPVDHPQLVVSIENKVNSELHSSQLLKYFLIVTEAFPQAQKLHLLLTRFHELPDHEAYRCITYSQVHSALADATAQKLASMGADQRAFIESYHRGPHWCRNTALFCLARNFK